MERIIDVKVTANYVVKSSNVAGAKGEDNVTTLRLAFDDSWDGLAKEITFYNSLGENPTNIVLTTDKLEDIATDTRVYAVLIPGSALEHKGDLTFVIDGVADGKKQRSTGGALEVLDSPVTRNVWEAQPSELQQMQVQIESIMNTIQDAAVSADAANVSASAANGYASDALYSEQLAGELAARAGEFAADADGSRVAAEAARDEAEASSTLAKSKATSASESASESQRHANNSQKYANNASEAATRAEDAAERAEEAANRAENAGGGGGGTGEPGKSPYIGDNGNWFEYNGTQYVDTGVKAQGKDGESGLPYIATYGNGIEGNLPAYTECRFSEPATWLVIYGFEYNTENPGNDMWAMTFTAGEGIYAEIPSYVEWAVAEPVFTEGYTYYLSFILFGEKILGIWVAKELS